MVEKFESRETGEGSSEVPARRRCAAAEVHHLLLAKSESYVRARNQIENLALAYRHGLRAVSRTETVRIPVVVHVVWNNEQENISDDQIQSQIDVLNKDFRKLNSDVSQVPSVWSGLTADLGIEFFLATEEPDGNPSTGITRTQTSKTSFNAMTDDVKFGTTGGKDAWPSDRYLNMWVCHVIEDFQGPGILGYAQFPGGPVETDGVVIIDTAFGTIGTVNNEPNNPYNKGRTATHEIGHWLNLFHIWGDDGLGCTGSDHVDDTPNQAGPNFNCPQHPSISCNNEPDGDMFMNYMDYVPDRCMVMFTQGQSVRVNACLEGPRSSFLTARQETETEKSASEGKMPMPR